MFPLPHDTKYVRKGKVKSLVRPWGGAGCVQVILMLECVVARHNDDVSYKEACVYKVK